MSLSQSIPFGRPQLGPEENESVARVLSGPQLVHGPVAKQLEQRFAERVGVRHAVSVSSCTAGLHLVLLAHGIGPGDRVIVPAMTHVATAHSVEFCGAQPVFVDVLPESGNMDPEATAALVDPSVRALVPVHYLGLPCDMTPIRGLARRVGVFILEDCALALDATYDKQKVGGLGVAGTFSFYPVKHMTTAEGGMVTTNDDALAGKVTRLKAFAYDRMLGHRARPGVYDVVGLGYNYRMSEVHAAIGLSQLAKLDGFQAARAQNFAVLKAALEELDEVTVFDPIQGPARSSHYCLNAVLPRGGGVDRDKLVAGLTARGVGSSVHYPSAVPLFTYYRDKYGYRPGQFPVAEWIAAQAISLPVGPHLERGDPERIGAAFKASLAEARV